MSDSTMDTGRPAHGHRAAKLPKTREELLKLHADARRARAAAELGSEAFREAVEELGRIEVEIARIERRMDPPRV